MPELAVDFEVYCACGEGLCGLTSTSPGQYGRGQFVTVEPCPKCMEKADDAGYDKGHDAAEKELREG